MSEWPTSPGFGQILVFVRRQLAVRESEPPAKTDAHRSAGLCLIEGPRHARTPIDHERLAARLSSDVPPADVEDLVLLRTQTGVVVKSAEEERDSRIVLQSLHPAIERLLEMLG